MRSNWKSCLRGKLALAVLLSVGLASSAFSEALLTDQQIAT
jgi:hypothetical protein